MIFGIIFAVLANHEPEASLNMKEVGMFRILKAVQHVRKVNALLRNRQFKEGLEVMVRWRIEEANAHTDITLTDQDANVLTQAALESFNARYNQSRSIEITEQLRSTILRDFDNLIQKWTALWGMRKVTLELMGVGDPTMGEKLKDIERQLIDSGFSETFLRR